MINKHKKPKRIRIIYYTYSKTTKMWYVLSGTKLFMTYTCHNKK